ncbi:poliovirus receptor-like isoform X3 [Anabas testudineus]|uniref:poliovirus receptor-like isoform X3 n=1 Tax=Anabas testudineus TaxID=64144 RepID=UPI000E45C9B8|nr:poliovirus receptor-like isoform X3 [Anabas testudineus]
MRTHPVFLSPLRNVFFTMSRSLSRFLSLMLLNVSLNLHRSSIALQVIGGNATVVQGETAILPCKLTDATEPLTQISWQRKTRGKPVNDNFFTVVSSGPNYVNGNDRRFKFIGNFSAHNGSLQLSEVTLLDEGSYSCIFTLFPSGNHRTEIPLNVLVPPVTSVKDHHPLMGNEEVLLATCTAAGSRPPAEVKWTYSKKVKAITNTTQHANGTTTTLSSLFGVPTRDINQQPVTCVVTSSALSKAETLPLTLQVHFSPTEVNISEISKDSFECSTEANPNANFTWSRPGQSWPQSAVRVDGAKLQFLSITSVLNGLYKCEASNLYGRKYGQLYVYVTSGTCTACWVLFSLLLLLIPIGVGAWWYFKKHPRTFSRPSGEGQQEETENL